MPDLTQPTLIGEIMKVIDRYGFKTMNARQMNAIIEGANIIYAELHEPHREAIPNSGLTNWLASDDVGMSSKFMAGVLSGRFTCENRHPLDPSDLGRCLRMLDACPELKPHVGRMAEHGPVWASLADEWDDLTALYQRELASGSAPQCYARMREIIERAEKETT